MGAPVGGREKMLRVRKSHYWGAFTNQNISANAGRTPGDVDLYALASPSTQARRMCKTERFERIGRDQFAFIIASFHNKYK